MRILKNILISSLALFFCVFIHNVERCGSAKILFAHILITQSHMDAVEPLAHKLADNESHQVTLMSPLATQGHHDRIIYFCPQPVVDLLKQIVSMGGPAVTDRVRSKYNDKMLSGEPFEGLLMICKVYYQSPEFKRFIRDSKFDLVILDGFGRECFLPVAHHWGAKYLIFSVLPLIYGERDAFGLPLETSWRIPWRTPGIVPDSILNEWDEIKWHLWRMYIFLPKFDRLAQEEFGWKDTPPIWRLEKNSSLYLLNTHYSSEPPSSLPPFVVQIAGINCGITDGISDSEVRSFVEDPDSIGFVYISWGTAIRISSLPLEQQKILFDTLGRFKKLKFVLKWEGELPEGVPKNVFVATWFKQQEILGHPKCRGFITQGGVMSYSQAVFHGVPIIVFPFSFDQIYHARTAEKLGFGIYMEISQMTVDSLNKAIRKLVQNKRYRKAAKRLSVLSQDRPIPPLDLAVWWTNFVIDHEPRILDHLKSPAIHKGMWVRRHAGIWIPLIAFLHLTPFLVYHLLKRLFFGRRKGPELEDDGITVIEKKKKKKRQ